MDNRFITNSFVAQSYGRSRNYTNIPAKLYKDYNVKKGLRNENGTGVRIGLTRISDVVGYDEIDGKKIAAPGKLYYRGYEVSDLVKGKKNAHNGYEETCFLLLFGYLPTKEELRRFTDILSQMYDLPQEFLEMHILRQPSKNLMNALQQSVLSLYDYDRNPDETDPYLVLLKGMNIMAKLPAILCYSYQSKMHFHYKDSLFIHYPRKDFSFAENILYMLREDRKFTEREANMLDILLMLHADHGGGNNSTFTSVVISSTNTDIYSAIVGSLGSLKGPRHGGANLRSVEMMETITKEIGYDATEEQIRDVISRIFAKDYYDNTGLVYGIGHAVYTISDPRAEILRDYAKELAEEKGKTQQFDFMVRFETIAKEMIYQKTGKEMATNVDFYSGFIYNLLGIPRDLVIPLFAVSRCVGWVAHNIENKLYDGRIMRPATKYVGEIEEYVKMEER